jgi:hypothetical protein
MVDGKGKKMKDKGIWGILEMDVIILRVIILHIMF